MTLNAHVQQEKKALMQWLMHLGEQIQDGTVILDATTASPEILHCNEAFTKMMHGDADVLKEKQLHHFNDDVTQQELYQRFYFTLATGQQQQLTVITKRGDDTTFWNEVSGYPISSTQGDVLLFFCICRDVTNAINDGVFSNIEKDVYASIHEERPLHSTLYDVCEQVRLFMRRPVYTVICLKKNNQFYIAGKNDTFKQWYERNQQAFRAGPYIYDEEEMIVSNRLWHHNRTLFQEQDIHCVWQQRINNQQQRMAAHFSVYVDGSVKLNAQERMYLQRVTNLLNVYLQVQQQKEEIERLAYTDYYSTLPNHKYFTTSMQTMYRQRKNGHIVILEISEFQHIIDLYGREGMSRLMEQMAKQMQQLVGEPILLARYDNASLIMCNDGQYDMKKLSAHILDNLTSAAYELKEHKMYITLKVGVSKYSAETHWEEAIHHAEIALSDARKSTGTVMRMYDESLKQNLQKEMDLLTHLLEDLQQRKLQVYLQPQVDLRTGEIVSFEALARWHSELLGFVSPAEFIRVAENAGKIHQLDMYILHLVLEWQSERKRKGLPMYPVSVNISADHFYYPKFVEDFTKKVDRFNVEHELIKVEVTESIELNDMQRAKHIISELTDLGFDVSMDDFGVGYSSLSYLQQLPFREIKIDRSFINNLIDQRMHAVMRTIVQLSKDLSLRSVAEGIETPEQQQKMLDIGCDIGQGYYFYRPMPLHEIDDILHKH